MATRPPPATPADPAPAARATHPIGTPPGGGRWTWDADAAAWVPLPDDDPDPTPAPDADKE